MLWASYYWFKNGISYTVNVLNKLPFEMSLRASEFTESGAKRSNLMGLLRRYRSSQ